MRGIQKPDDPEAAQAIDDVSQALATAADPAQRPASWVALALCFAFADLIALAIARVYSGNGRSRASRQACKATGYGWLLRFAIIAFLLIPWRRSLHRQR